MKVKRVCTLPSCYALHRLLSPFLCLAPIIDTATMADPALRLLLLTKVSVLVRPGGAHAIATLTPDATVEQALATLASHKVLSAPIVGADKVRAREGSLGSSSKARVPGSARRGRGEKENDSAPD